MGSIAQTISLQPAALGAGERARFWRVDRHDALEGLTAVFRKHRYALHTHETYVIGVIEAGCETFTLRGERQYARPGDLCFVHPGDVHDGEPLGDAYAYRTTYPAEPLLRSISAELAGRDLGAPSFRQGTVHDPETFQLFRAAHRLLEAGGDRLGGDEALFRAYAVAIARYAAPGPPEGRARAAPSAVARVRDLLEARFEEDLDLATLAGVAGLSRFQLLRAFRRAYGLTPHAYLTDVRVRAARRRLIDGEAPAEVAAACGFFDQSHLTRAFKARAGVGPGAYRSA